MSWTSQGYDWAATWHCIVRSHRLELMRQIYNMNEAAYAEEEETTPLVLAPPPAVLQAQAQGAGQQDILQCISACAQQTRLSLANLLPSRFVVASLTRNRLQGCTCTVSASSSCKRTKLQAGITSDFFSVVQLCNPNGNDVRNFEDEFNDFCKILNVSNLTRVHFSTSSSSLSYLRSNGCR